MENTDYFYILKDYPFCFGFGVYLLLNPNSIDDIKKASECFEISAHEVLTNKKFAKKILRDSTIFRNSKNLYLSNLMKSIQYDVFDVIDIKLPIAQSLINLSSSLMKDKEKIYSDYIITNNNQIN